MTIHSIQGMNPSRARPLLLKYKSYMISTRSSLGTVTKFDRIWSFGYVQAGRVFVSEDTIEEHALLERIYMT